MKSKQLLPLVLTAMLFSATSVFAQVKIGDNPTTINAGSVLELESTNKGLLMPRIALTNTTTWGLAGTAAAGMHVYNTNTGITSTNSTYPTLNAKVGEYYWDGTGWVALGSQSQTTPVQVKVAGVNQTINGAASQTQNQILLNATTIFDTGNNKVGNTIVVPSAGLYDVAAYVAWTADNASASGTNIGGWGIRLRVNNIEVGQFAGGILTDNASDAGGGRILTRLNAGDVLTFYFVVALSSGTVSTNNSTFSVIKLSN
jgi:hypothetical protein